MKKLVLILVVSQVVLTASAKVGFKVEMNHPDALYRLGEEAVLTVTATNAPGVLAREGQVDWRLDNFTEEGVVAKGAWDFSTENPRTFRWALNRPDFLRLRITGDLVNDLSAWHRRQFWWGVGFEPTKIQPGGPNPADFDAFWADAITRLERSVPLDAKVTRVPARSTKAYDYFRISFATVGGRRVYGFMSVPTDKSKAPYPVIFEVSSAGQGRWTMDMDRGLPDRIRVYFTVHSFDPPATVEELQPLHAELAAENFRRYGTRDYAVSGIAVSREEYYFYDKILGINRALDWVAARPDVDRKRIGYVGGSQGGGFGWYLAGLNKNIASCVLHVPALSDMLGIMGGHASGWPHLVENLPANLKENAKRNLPYFDGANFARRVTCPIRVSVGFVDTACNPASVYAAFNVCPSKNKKISDGVGLGHFGQTAVLDRVNDLWQRNLGKATD